MPGGLKTTASLATPTPRRLCGIATPTPPWLPPTSRCMTPKLDALGLHFRNVLGDALCAKRRLARRLSHVTRRSSRHRVRPELVHVLRDPAGPTLPSRVGRGDDIARSTDFLRP